MDPFTLGVITYIAAFLGFWSCVTLIMLSNIMIRAKKERGVCRTTDKKMFTFTLLFTSVMFFVVFIWPGLIFMIPATVAFIEIATIPILGYVSEVAFKHMQRMQDTNEVDEHTTI